MCISANAFYASMDEGGRLIMWWSYSSPMWGVWPVFPILGVAFMVLVMFVMLRMVRSGKMMCGCAGKKEIDDLRKNIDHLRVEMDTLRKSMREGKP